MRSRNNGPRNRIVPARSFRREDIVPTLCSPQHCDGPYSSHWCRASRFRCNAAKVIRAESLFRAMNQHAQIFPIYLQDPANLSFILFVEEQPAENFAILLREFAEDA